MSPSKRLASRLKEARGELHISQFELGVKAGIDEATAKARVSHYETGRSIPTLPTLELLAVALEKPIGWFLAEDDELELYSSLAKMNKREKTEILKHIKQKS